MSSIINISYSYLTNQGEREVNEDYLDTSTTTERLAFILCDGLGGHGNGDVASRFVVDEMKIALEQGMSIQKLCSLKRYYLRKVSIKPQFWRPVSIRKYAEIHLAEQKRFL
ncbi:MAG: hypothetical protein Q4F98_03780 [Lachnospiraceae bacterium]|nr:hypothetical protein [Lachnospiraceae bacterium]